jgi:hypothetical protein
MESTPPPLLADTTDVHAQTRMQKTMSVRVVQISRRNAFSSRPQDHGLHFADQHPSHQCSIVGKDFIQHSVCTTISSGGASSEGASSGRASPGGASPKGANMDRNARSLQRYVPQGGRHP